MSNIISKIRYYIKNLYKIKAIALIPFYRSFLLPAKIKKMRKKEEIVVLFVIDELGSWKTENLYLKMLQHRRFNPSLLLLQDQSAHYSYNILKEYLEEKGYEYKTIDEDETIQKKFSPDIIFYQKPYENIIDDKYFYYKNLNSIFCYVLYCFRNRNRPGLNDIRFLNFVWQLYAENEKVIEERKKLIKNGDKMLCNTGLSFMDDLLLEKSCYPDPWKHEDRKKKRIIYAPHHTIYTDLYAYATFLDYCDFMIDMVKKYQQDVQWVFKPHPLLKAKLYKIWGKDKTDRYYQQWESNPSCQISEGEYMGLFKHSDALIHDCGSFKLEYLYTHNPVLYLIKENQEFDYPNWQTQEAMRLHYQAKMKEDIEAFIVNVIKGIDPLKKERDTFVSKYLTPPHGKSACQNIINAILGEEEYA